MLISTLKASVKELKEKKFIGMYKIVLLMIFFTLPYDFYNKYFILKIKCNCHKFLKF